MMCIGICDEVYEECKIVYNMCEKYFKVNRIEHKYEVFNDSEDVLKYCEKKGIDILFINTKMFKVENVKLKKLRYIVFITNNDESVYEAFSVKTIGFIKKPPAQKYINKVFSLAINEMVNNIVIKITNVDGQVIGVELDDILYLKAFGSYTQIVFNEITGSNHILTTKKLGVWEKELNNLGIIRVHKSYMANLSKIAKITRNISIMGLVEEIPIGRKYKMNVKQRYMNYIEDGILKNS